MPESTLPHARADFIPQSGTLDLASGTGLNWFEICMGEKVAVGEWERVVISKRACVNVVGPAGCLSKFM
jgi:hypothetical protein